MATSANQEYDGVPLSALRKETRLKLSKYLDRKGMRLKVEIDNIPTDIFDDFTGLAKQAGQEDFIDTVKCQNQEQSPTGRLFDRLNDCGYTIETFLGYLLVMKRYDVIKDCIKLIVGDLLRFLDPKLVTRWNELSDDFESSSLSELLCVVNPKIAARWSKIFNDIENSYLSSSYHRWECFDATISERLPIYVSDVIDYTFDAFVCYNQDDPGDKQFVQDLIEELECRRGLRLYVPGRDDQPDASEHINNAGEIERRCRRVIIVMSRSYLQSTIWEFQEQFAQALLPDARRNRLITMLRERDVVLPEVLEGCNTLDYNEMNQEFSVEEPRMFEGSEYQSLGATYMKLCSPYDTDLIFVGITNEVASFFDLKFRLGS
ncbi:hypothetical protein DPMN_119928 [Dreissena polymorpha]|uniref:TIR domain-containing protein n=1 Tax=Dreissena polymorpha TaxID=45954 RepID=A0A9D4GMT0_DREPO|nr:hypothetical protein DPMN_119928 [Dreissena polymorpha]